MNETCKNTANITQSFFYTKHELVLDPSSLTSSQRMEYLD